VASLSVNFLFLVAIAILIAIPVAWWIMNKWLEDFAYRIRLNGWYFLTVGMTALLIACVTVSFQAIRAARVNPVKNLRTE
jgi:putative ABC transport system permease protein